MKVHISHSLEETHEIAKDWLISISGDRNDSNPRTTDSNAEQSVGATVIGLSGHLGAGKTAFVKLVAKLLGVKEEVTSPTFVIMKMYEVDSSIELSNNLMIPWRRLVHIDAYRLERPEELEVLNFEKLVADPHNLIMVEWPENVDLIKNPNVLRLEFEIEGGELSNLTLCKIAFSI